MSKIIVSVSNDLIGDRRVDKVCFSLHNAGYETELIGCIKGKTGSLERPYRTRRFKMLFKKGFMFYFEYNLRLMFILLFSKKDALLCNDTDALPANYIASILSGKPLVFDAHELFPEVPEVVNRKFVKAFWQKIEDLIFPHLKYCYTVCGSIAEYYHKRYGINMRVVRNIPSLNTISEKDIDIHIRKEGKHILLYQGAVNVGRGVEWLISAMKYIDDSILYICGNGDLLDEMKCLAQKEGVGEKVIFTGRIPAEKLDQYTIQADLGFVLLDNMGLSYYYSLPNRIFDYMKYGVPILATGFPEISAIVKGYDTGITTSSQNPEEIARIIKDILNNKNKTFDKEQIKEKAKLFGWENEEKNILLTVKEALTKKCK